MSIKQMQKVWDNTDLEANKKLIMLSLCDNANDEGFCYPSLNTTCKKTGLSKPTVIKHQNELEEQGYLVSKKRNRKKRGGRASTIYIVFPQENIEFLDEELLERFELNAIQSKEALPPIQSKEALPLQGIQSKEALPHEPSLSLFNHHLYRDLSNKEKDLFLEYLKLRTKMKLKTTSRIKERLLKKYHDFGRDENIILNAINANWKDFYPLKQNNTQKDFRSERQKTNDAVDKYFSEKKSHEDEVVEAEVISWES